MADFPLSITSAKANKCSVAFVYRLFLSKHSVCRSCSSTRNSEVTRPVHLHTMPNNLSTVIVAYSGTIK